MLKGLGSRWAREIRQNVKLSDPEIFFDAISSYDKQAKSLVVIDDEKVKTAVEFSHSAALILTISSPIIRETVIERIIASVGLFQYIHRSKTRTTHTPRWKQRHPSSTSPHHFDQP